MGAAHESDASVAESVEVGESQLRSQMVIENDIRYVCTSGVG
jgi:hypothetical protein